MTADHDSNAINAIGSPWERANDYDDDAAHADDCHALAAAIGRRIEDEQRRANQEQRMSKSDYYCNRNGRAHCDHVERTVHDDMAYELTRLLRCCHCNRQRTDTVPSEHGPHAPKP